MLSSKSNDKYPYKREKRRRGRGKEPVQMKADVIVVQPWSRNIWSHQKLEKTGRSLSQSRQRNTTLISAASRIVKE